ncbi:MAG: ABC transporter permease [Acidobacteriia bacterium]|nr:ABC transporter permease [Terriglobia bacterium]
MWKGLLHGVRALRRSPVFTTAAVLSLALGIGANTAIFSLLDQVVLRSLPIADPERLFAVHGSYSGPGNSSSSWSTNSESVFPYPFYRDLRDRDPAFAGTLACAIAPVRIAWRSSTQAADAEIVTGNYFPTLGASAALGRVIVPDDDGAPGANPVAVLSHGFWANRLGADPAILNQKVAINGQPFVVIGVAGADFNGLVQGESPDLFVPIAMQRAIAPAMNPIEDRSFSWLTIFARLKPGESQAQAQAATNVVYHAIREADLSQGGGPHDQKTREALLKSRLELRPAAHGITELRERWEKPLTVLMIMVGLVLLIACANVAGLLVARAAGRQREIAIRLALGAKRWALVKQLLIEGVLLAVTGMVAGLLLEHWSTSALLRILPRDATGGWVTNSLDLRVLGYSLAVSMVCALLFALVPALQATRPDVAGILKDQASNVLSRGSSARLRRMLVTAQVALSLMLVVGAGLFSVSAANLINADRGFRTKHLSMFSVDATLIRTGPAAAAAFYHDLLERLSALAEQGGVAAGDGGPYSGAGWGSGIQVEGYHPDKGFASSSLEAISPGYFHTLGIPLRAGREFNDRDTTAAPKAVVVNEAFVKRYFAGQNPIGRHVGILGPKAPALDREIVGITADVRTNVRRPVGSTIFFPYTQREKPARLAFYVRVTGDDAHLAAAIRRAVREADAGLPVPEIKPVELRIGESLYTTRVVAGLSTAFGILATLLAAIGLYGVIAFAVARRTGEIGVRMALGALPADVVRMVLLDAGRVAAGGIVIGLAAAFVLSRYVESQLFGIQAANLVVYAGATGTLAAVVALAAFVPAWRASRINPVSALRHE